MSRGARMRIGIEKRRKKKRRLAHRTLDVSQFDSAAGRAASTHRDRGWFARRDGPRHRADEVALWCDATDPVTFRGVGFVVDQPSRWSRCFCRRGGIRVDPLIALLHELKDCRFRLAIAIAEEPDVLCLAKKGKLIKPHLWLVRDLRDRATRLAR